MIDEMVESGGSSFVGTVIECDFGPPPREICREEVLVFIIDG